MAASLVVMPRLSDSMEEGTILSWIKSPGDHVDVGDELVEIETDKANMVYEAEVAGTLLEVLVPEGEPASVGATIARIGASDETVEPSSAGNSVNSASGTTRTEPDQQEPPQGTPGDDRVRLAPAATSAPPASDGPRAKASPLARRLAREHDVDLRALSGFGFGGRIVKADVESALSSEHPAPDAAPVRGSNGSAGVVKGDVEAIPLTKLQRTVARRMSESKATAPHFHLSAELDMSRGVTARRSLKEGIPDGAVVPSINDLVVKACAIALREFPRVNGAYRGDEIELYQRINVGIAVAAQGALVVPTIFDADKKGLGEIAAASRSLSERVREGVVTPPELSGGTFTVSNLGMYGVETFQAVLNPPQAAILAVGQIAERPVARSGQLAVGSVMTVSLGCDHRVLSGAEGAMFLRRVGALLEEPVGLAL